MFLANLFKHLRAESVEHQAKLALAGLHGKFESHPRLTKKGWKYVQTLDYRTFRLCKVVQGNSAKFHKLVEDVMSQPGYEEDTLAHMFMAYGHDGPDRRLTLNDVWEVHMPTAWYIDKLLHCFSTGNQTPIDLLIAKGDEFHKQFMTLKETGNLEGQGLQYVLDIMQSYVILTALPQEWSKETNHTCICKCFFKHGACEHCASMAMLMDCKVIIPKSAVLKKLQHRPCRG